MSKLTNNEVYLLTGTNIYCLQKLSAVQIASRLRRREIQVLESSNGKMRVTGDADNYEGEWMITRYPPG